VAEVSSSLNHHGKWMIPESNFITLQGILTHTLRNFPFRATIPLIFRVVDQRHYKRLQDHTHIQCAGRTSKRDYMTVFPCVMQNILPHCNRSRGFPTKFARHRNLRNNYRIFQGLNHKNFTAQLQWRRRVLYLKFPSISGTGDCGKWGK
jgi:hypothetical protein